MGARPEKRRRAAVKTSLDRPASYAGASRRLSRGSMLKVGLACQTRRRAAEVVEEQAPPMFGAAAPFGVVCRQIETGEITSSWRPQKAIRVCRENVLDP